jgi:hypothetical protein
LILDVRNHQLRKPTVMGFADLWIAQIVEDRKLPVEQVLDLFWIRLERSVGQVYFLRSELRL